MRVAKLWVPDQWAFHDKKLQETVGEMFERFHVILNGPELQEWVQQKREQHEITVQSSPWKLDEFMGSLRNHDSINP